MYLLKIQNGMIRLYRFSFENPLTSAEFHLPWKNLLREEKISQRDLELETAR